eukprot:PhM_4_TR13728/c0_g1_i4/m.82082
MGEASHRISSQYRIAIASLTLFVVALVLIKYIGVLGVSDASPAMSKMLPSGVDDFSSLGCAYTVLVVGGSRGIGRQAVLDILATYPEGCVLFTSTKPTSSLNPLSSDSARRVHHAMLNITSEASRRQFLQFVTLHHAHGFDAVVVTAGVFSFDPVLCMETNFIGPVRLVVELLAMDSSTTPATRKGSINVIFVSTISAQLKYIRKYANFVPFFKSVDNITLEDVFEHAKVEYGAAVLNGSAMDKARLPMPYTVSKLYLNLATRVLSKHHPAAINAINPGHTRTDMTNGRGKYTVQQSVKPILHLLKLGVSLKDDGDGGATDRPPMITGQFFSHDYGNVMKVRW